MVGIPSAPRGVPQIDVAFEVDANGIVSVSATDKATGLEQQMRITPTSGLSQEEIERLITEAEASIESDRREGEKISLQDKLRSLITNTQRAFTEFGGLLSLEEQYGGQQALKDAQDAVTSSELGELRLALERLERLGRQLTKAMLNQPAEARAKED